MKLPSLFRWIFVLIGLGILVACGFGWQDRYLHAPLPIEQAQELDVERGATFGTVVHELNARGLLPYPKVLQLYARLNARGAHIQAGEYLLGPGTTPLDLLGMLEQGRVRLHAVTLVEGWTLAQALQQLGKAGLTDTLSAVPPNQLLSVLGVDASAGRSPEGLFFPDTYVFSGRTADRDILLQAYRRMQRVLTQEWDARAPDLPYTSPYDALIMASIVERETGAAIERPAIAGVFVRRLQQDMLLQTDPAVIYGLGASFDGNLRRRDLENADNPYNTYAHRGLPPSPIALPGRAAIHAALQPSPGDALYFVAKGDGSHQFSSTLSAHTEAVKKYQLGPRRADYHSRPGI